MLYIQKYNNEPTSPQQAVQQLINNMRLSMSYPVARWQLRVGAAAWISSELQTLQKLTNQTKEMWHCKHFLSLKTETLIRLLSNSVKVLIAFVS